MMQVTQPLLLNFGIILMVATQSLASKESMKHIPAGVFTMGTESRGPNEKPAHEVELDAYYVGTYEVTNQEYYRFWQATGKHTPECFPDDYGIGVWPGRALKYPDHPVVGVSWYGAVAYSKWVGMRLPTEAEWEKAARGSTNRRWPWGNSPHPYANTWNGEDGYDNGIAPVGSYPEGKSEYGVMDMAGNVWEWTSDWYSDTYYLTSPKRNPKGPEMGSWRAIRGGSWIDNINLCETTVRIQFYPGLNTSFIGFRLAQSAKSSSEKSQDGTCQSRPQK